MFQTLGTARLSDASPQVHPGPRADSAVLIRQQAFACALALLLSGCDESDPDLAVGASSNAAAGPGSSAAPASTASITSADPGAFAGRDLTVLGTDANANQQAFRARFGLQTPTPQDLAGMAAYDARFTVYSDVDPDWPSPTVALQNWRGAVDVNGSPLGVDGTTVAVDFRRVPPHSLLYIPATDQFVEAIDTGATSQWVRDDAGKIDYGADGLGRIDIQSSAQGRSPQEVERQFGDWIGSSEYGHVYIVFRGGNWKKEH